MTTFNGLKIVVEDGRWNAYGNPESTMHKGLFEILEQEGGISDTVEPGVYDFYLTVDFTGIHMVLKKM